MKVTEQHRQPGPTRRPLSAPPVEIRVPGPTDKAVRRQQAEITADAVALHAMAFPQEQRLAGAADAVRAFSAQGGGVAANLASGMTALAGATAPIDRLNDKLHRLQAEAPSAAKAFAQDACNELGVLVRDGNHFDALSAHIQTMNPWSEAFEQLQSTFRSAAFAAKRASELANLSALVATQPEGSPARRALEQSLENLTASPSRPDNQDLITKLSDLSQWDQVIPPKLVAAVCTNLGVAVSNGNHFGALVNHIQTMAPDSAAFGVLKQLVVSTLANAQRPMVEASLRRLTPAQLGQFARELGSATNDTTNSEAAGAFDAIMAFVRTHPTRLNEVFDRIAEILEEAR